MLLLNYFYSSWSNYSRILFSLIFLSIQIFLCSTIITFSSAWIIYKQFWRSCGIFGSNQSFIITFHPPSVSRSSSTSLIFHSTSISIDVRGIFPPAGNLLHLFVEITREIVHRLNKNYVRRWSRVIRWTDERREGGSMNSSWRIFTAQLNVLVSNASLGHGHPSRGDQSCFTLTLLLCQKFEFILHSTFIFIYCFTLRKTWRYRNCVKN